MRDYVKFDIETGKITQTGSTNSPFTEMLEIGPGVISGELNNRDYYVFWEDEDDKGRALNPEIRKRVVLIPELTEGEDVSHVRIRGVEEDEIYVWVDSHKYGPEEVENGEITITLESEIPKVFTIEIDEVTHRMERTPVRVL